MITSRAFCVAVTICATLANIETDTQTDSIWPAYMSSSANWAKSSRVSNFVKRLCMCVCGVKACVIESWWNFAHGTQISRPTTDVNFGGHRSRHVGMVGWGRLLGFSINLWLASSSLERSGASRYRNGVWLIKSLPDTIYIFRASL